MIALLALALFAAGKAETQRIVVGPKVVGHAEGDVDGDGRCDLLLAIVPEKAEEDRAIALFLQKPDGRFAAAPDLRIPVKRDVIAWALGDLLPEPGLEILFLARGAAFAFLPRGAAYRENARRIATFESLFEMAAAEDLPRWPHLLDVDGDSLPELLVPERDRVRVFGRVADRPDAEWAERGAIPARRDRHEARSDRGGARRRGREVTISFGVGGPQVGVENDPFLAGPETDREKGNLVTASSSLHIPVVADATGDGRADLLLLAGGTLRVHAQDGGGRFPDAPTWEGKIRKEEGWPDEIRVRDLDGDGRAELLALGSTEGGLLGGTQVLEVLRGGPAGPVLDVAATRLKFEGYGVFPECVDVDGDGILDLAVAVLDVPATPDTLATGARLEWTYQVFRGIRGGGVERESAIRFTEGWEAGAVAGLGMIATCGGDVDGDGVCDFVRIAPDGRVAAQRLVKRKGGGLERESSPLFEAPIDRVAKDLAVLRLDGDARADVVVLHDDGFTTVRPR